MDQGNCNNQFIHCLPSDFSIWFMIKWGMSTWTEMALQNSNSKTTSPPLYNEHIQTLGSKETYLKLELTIIWCKWYNCSLAE